MARTTVSRHLPEVPPGSHPDPVRARPLRLKPDDIKLIVNALRNRNVLEASAAMAGIPRSTLYDALRRGRQVAEAIEEGAKRSSFSTNDRRLAQFSEAVNKAMAEAQVHTVALIGRAGQEARTERTTKRRYVGLDAQNQPIYAEETTVREFPGDWRALAMLLERRWPKEWAPRVRTELSGPEGGPIPVEQRVDVLLGRVLELRQGAIDVGPEADEDSDYPDDSQG
jgi:hypothetical protein